MPELLCGALRQFSVEVKKAAYCLATGGATEGQLLELAERMAAAARAAEQRLSAAV